MLQSQIIHDIYILYSTKHMVHLVNGTNENILKSLQIFSLISKTHKKRAQRLDCFYCSISSKTKSNDIYFVCVVKTRKNYHLMSSDVVSTGRKKMTILTIFKLQFDSVSIQFNSVMYIHIIVKQHQSFFILQI